MSRENARDAAESEYVASMGVVLGPMFYTLWQHTARAHSEFHAYATLFGSSPERHAMLYRAGGLTIQHLESALWESVLLNLVRLTDPASTGKKANVTVQQLPLLVPDALIPTLAISVADAVASTRFAEDARNKWIAHLDAVTMLDETAPELTLGSRMQVRAALRQLSDVLSLVLQHYEGNRTSFQARDAELSAERLVALVSVGMSDTKSIPAVPARPR